MNKLKKGDRCKFQHLEVTIVSISDTGLVEIICNVEDSGTWLAHISELTRIQTHAERMQKVIDNAFDAENRLDDSETVQLQVGELAEFARHYLAIKGTLQAAVDDTRQRMNDAESALSTAEKLLKGES
jgi:hypothetical protein